MHIFNRLIYSYLFFLFIILFIEFKSIQTIRWLGLAQMNRHASKELHGFSEIECSAVREKQIFRKRHFRFCKHDKHKYAMHGVLMASKAAAYYCMRTFRNRRWNCKSVEKFPKMSPELKLGTREQAIVHAFASSAIVFEISRRCSESKLRHCTCGRQVDDGDSSNSWDSNSNSRTRKYIQNICPDNLEMGILYAKRFLGYHMMGKPKPKNKNSKKKRKRKRKKFRPAALGSKSKWSRKQVLKRLNGHNYEVGIEIMKRSWKSHCKCHGVSGSCTYETCFRQMRRLDDDVLLQILKDHYLKAKHVVLNDDGKFYPSYYSPDNKYKKPLTTQYLAFTQHSPDYCEPDKFNGSIGTHGRECRTVNVTSSAPDHCNNMCCGRGHREEVQTRSQRCKCELRQNFTVKCQWCSLIDVKKYCL